MSKKLFKDDGTLNTEYLEEKVNNSLKNNKDFKKLMEKLAKN